MMEEVVMKKTVFPRVWICAWLAVLFLVVAAAGAVAGELDDVRAAIGVRGAAWVAAENPVSLLPPDQRKLRLGLIKPQAPSQAPFVAAVPPPTGLAASLDWRNYNSKNFVTPVRDQGNCGSCWAFATAAALESYTLIADNMPGTDENLSEQVLVSCSGAGNCNGGYIEDASEYIRDKGLPLESCYYYTGGNGNCANACRNYQTDTFHIGSWSYLATSSPTVDAIKNALSAYGPLVTTMDVYSDFFYYKSGVYSYTSGTYQGGHAILIVGYDDTAQCFVVKNSWAADWGEQGFFRIAYTQLNSRVYFGWWTLAYHPSETCTYGISPSSQTFPRGGGTGSISVNCSATNCPWTAVSNDSWITITQGAGGSGSVAVFYTVAKNPARKTRVGTITVAGQAFIINQKKVGARPKNFGGVPGN
jgi:hypothetical protein